MTYYVVCWHDAWDDPLYAPEDYQSNRAAYEEQDIWTISEDPKREGWNTDSGCSGYGLTYAEAKKLANAANVLPHLLKVLEEIEDICMDYEPHISRIQELAKTAREEIPDE